jgi:hypothetical protein
MTPCTTVGLRAIALLVALPLASLGAQTSPRAYVGATLVNPGEAPIANAVVVVKDGLIQTVWFLKPRTAEPGKP